MDEEIIFIKFILSKTPWHCFQSLL